MRSEPLGEVISIVDVADELMTDPLFIFNCGVVMLMLLSLLTVTELPTVTLELDEMLTAPPFKLRVATVAPELAKLSVPFPVGATDIVPPVVASVPANPAGAVMTRLTSAAELPESTLTADAPVAVNDGLVVVAANAKFGPRKLTAPPPLTVNAAASAIVSVLPAAIARNAVVLAALLPNEPVPASVRLLVLWTVIVGVGDEPV